ncbi:universal stress protein [Amycolatopsis sp. NBRC 101858]|uniref:universal stress protein n=1 Tax=Amycolatopsis sp. NBRC 101858 TaxID=3032200 RepID=UPI0024A26DB1|nr:universal stress protein [Amycolatopsis sp. NBRC 101858]GLY42775.1 universal stress protein [Amycolatopsis sp. NBRC 101858]
MTTTEAPVVVTGYDGTPESLRAVFWAATEADRRGNTLVVARALDWSWPGGSYPEVVLAPLSGGAERLRREAEQQTRDAVREIGHSHPDLEVRMVLLEDLPGPALARIAARAEAVMVVVGPPGSGPLGRAFFGSATAGLTKSSGRPLVVVRGEDPAEGATRYPVVVGLDPAADNSAALAFALDFARRHAVPVHLVHAMTGRFRRNTALSEPMVTELTDWLSSYPEVPFEHEIVQDFPEHALLDRARQASLLVVGDSRQSFLRRAVCGSVSRTVLHYAPCPVSVVGVGK